MAALTPSEVSAMLRFVEEQTAAAERGRREGWPPDAIEAIEDERDNVARELRMAGHDERVRRAIERGEAAFEGNPKKKKKKKAKGKAKKTKAKGKARKAKFGKLDWEKSVTPEGAELWQATVEPTDPDLWPTSAVVVGQEIAGGPFILGLYHLPTDHLTVFPEERFDTAEQAKKHVESVIFTGIEDVRAAANRRPNREVGDIVLAAEQYFAAQQEELSLMKRGTPEQLARARQKTKKAKEVLEDMTGANRELYGSIGGGTLGATLAALTGNVFIVAIGALAGSVVGSIIARPSLPKEKPPTPRRARPREELEAEVIPFPRRTAAVPRRPTAANPQTTMEAYDNEGETADRYTVFFPEYITFEWDRQKRAYVADPSMLLCAGGNRPFHPQGIGWVESCHEEYRDRAGKRIAFEDLPEDMQRLALGVAADPKGYGAVHRDRAGETFKPQRGGEPWVPNPHRSPIDAMAWSPDPLVRDIASEIDDRPVEDIAESVMEVWHRYDREFQNPRATERLTRVEAVDATTLASHVVDWANYATAYGDYESPPWERLQNPDVRRLIGR